MKILNLLLGNLNLGCPTWLSWLGWAMKTVMPRARDDQIVVFHPFVRFGKVEDEPNNVGSRFKIVSHSFLAVTLIHMYHVKLGEFQA